MSSETKRSNEFKRYRQVLLALYVAAASAGFVLLVASVVSHLFFRKPDIELPNSAIVSSNPHPEALLECNTFVLEQLTSLTTMTSELLERPTRGQGSDLASDWKNFSMQWRDRWDVIDARCRFSELAETTMGEAYDRMAHVHEALPAMRLKYNSLLADFEREQAAELSEMRSALDKSRKAIAAKVGTEEAAAVDTDAANPQERVPTVPGPASLTAPSNRSVP